MSCRRRRWSYPVARRVRDKGAGYSRTRPVDILVIDTEVAQRYVVARRLPVGYSQSRPIAYRVALVEENGRSSDVETPRSQTVGVGILEIRSFDDIVVLRHEVVVVVSGQSKSRCGQILHGIVPDIIGFDSAVTRRRPCVQLRVGDVFRTALVDSRAAVAPKYRIIEFRGTDAIRKHGHTGIHRKGRIEHFGIDGIERNALIGMEQRIVYERATAATGNFHHRQGLGNAIVSSEFATAQRQFGYVFIVGSGFGLVAESRSVGIFKGDILYRNGYDRLVRLSARIVIFPVGHIFYIEEGLDTRIYGRNDGLISFSPVDGTLDGNRLPLVVVVITAGDAYRLDIFRIGGRFIVSRTVLGIDDEPAVLIDGINRSVFALGHKNDFVFPVTVEDEPLDSPLQVAGSGSPMTSRR